MSRDTLFRFGFFALIPLSLWSPNGTAQGAMAQLVARFHGMEEVGGSNPPSSTENSDTQLVGVGFLLFLDGLSALSAHVR